MPAISRATALCLSLVTLSAGSLRAAPYASPSGFSLEPPARWTLTENPDFSSVLWTAPGAKPSAPSLHVSTQSLAGVVVPSAALPRAVSQIVAADRKSMIGFTLAETGSTMLGGAPARYVTATYRQTAHGPVWKLRQVAAIRGRRRVVIACAAPASAFAKIQPVLSLALAHFQFITPFTPPYHSGAGYLLTPAEGWTAQVVQAGADTHFVEPGLHPYPANMGVHISPAPAGFSIDDLYAHRTQVEAGLAKEGQYTPGDNGLETVSGEKAMFITAQLHNPDLETPLWVRIEFVAHAGKLYRFTGLCPDDGHEQYNAAFQAMLQSLRWED